MRKEGKGRKYRQQFINVPKFLFKEGLTEDQQKTAELIKNISNDPGFHTDLFVPNKSKFAGKRKRIVHELAPKY